MIGLANRMSLSLGSALNGGGVAIASRNFTTLVTAESKTYSISTSTLSADFIIECDFLLNDHSAQAAILGGASGTDDFLRLDPTDGGIDFKINGVFFGGSPGAFTPDNKLHHLSLVRLGNDFTVFLDDVSVQTYSSSTSPMVVEFIGRRNGGAAAFFAGVISDFKITDAGTLDRFYKIDETWAGPSTVLIDYGTDGSNGTAVNITTVDSETFTRSGNDFLGVDIWTHGDISAVSATTGFVGGVSVTAVSGFTYKLFYDVANFVEGSTTAIVGAAGASRTANGTFTDIITATGTSAGWDVATNPTTLDVNNGIIKRILEGA